VVEEQTPTPDRQKLTVRMSGQWDAAGGREGLAAALAAGEADKPKAGGKEAPPNRRPPARAVPGARPKPLAGITPE
jgi:hypothetical protein